MEARRAQQQKRMSVTEATAYVTAMSDHQRKELASTLIPRYAQYCCTALPGTNERVWSYQGGTGRGGRGARGARRGVGRARGRGASRGVEGQSGGNQVKRSRVYGEISLVELVVHGEVWGRDEDGTTRARYKEGDVRRRSAVQMRGRDERGTKQGDVTSMALREEAECVWGPRLSQVLAAYCPRVWCELCGTDMAYGAMQCAVLS
eukprot:952798-Rhodomonas_salina.1